MARLAADPNAFIRPSPASGTLGGVAAKTRETMLLCEAAGYDVVLVETVGIGQSETTVADMTDFFLVLMLPGAGDELQGIKKGVVELADMIAVNKADGDNITRANAAAAEYRAALHILTPRSPTWAPPVITYSGLTGNGIDALWQQVLAHRAALTASGELAARRREQQVKWMWTMLEERLMGKVQADPAVKARLPALEAAVAEGRISADGGGRRDRSGAGVVIRMRNRPHHRLRAVSRRAVQPDRDLGAEARRAAPPGIGRRRAPCARVPRQLCGGRSRAAGADRPMRARRAADVRARGADAPCADRDAGAQHRVRARAGRRRTTAARAMHPAGRARGDRRTRAIPAARRRGARRARPDATVARCRIAICATTSIGARSRRAAPRASRASWCSCTCR